ncbi:MAG TPA: 4Fe-4S dicluster domain-containing protein [Oscillatoriaceae cyanobacterium]
MTPASRYVRTRKAVQLALAGFWLSLPLAGLLQIDLAHLRLVLFGHAWPPPSGPIPVADLARGASAHWEFVLPVLLGVVLPVVVLAVSFVLSARYLGRVHCGFSCTYGFLAETGENLFRWARKPGAGRTGRLALAWGLVLAAAPGVAFTILSLFARPSGVWHGLATDDPTIVVPFLVLGALATILGGVVRFKFCRYVCGVGLVQSLAWMTNKKALEVGFHAERSATHGSLRDCNGCHGCRDACPVGFDPRQPKRYMMACIQCGLCLTACEDELHPLGKGAALGLHLYDPSYPLKAQEPPMPRILTIRPGPASVGTTDATGASPEPSWRHGSQGAVEEDPHSR